MRRQKPSDGFEQDFEALRKVEGEPSV